MPPRDGVPISIVQKQVDPAIIDDLELLLERARAGEIVGMGWVAFLDSREVMHHFTPRFSDHLYTAIGAVRALEQDLLDLIERR